MSGDDATVCRNCTSGKDATNGRVFDVHFDMVVECPCCGGDWNNCQRCAERGDDEELPDTPAR